MNNDLISRHALLKRFGTDPYFSIVPSDRRIFEIVNFAPAVDAVEVVRCKDCIHTTRSRVNPEKIICCLTLMYGTTNPDFYCANGECKEVQDE